MAFYGDVLDSSVIEQLRKRNEVLGSAQSSTRSLGTRNTSDLRYLLQKNAWVRVISGVNTTSGGNGPAKEFILFGGAAKWDGKNFQKNQGINFTSSDVRKTYNYSERYGIVPQAGITSFQLKNLGTYGTFRQANIGFTVFTKEELERAQTIYLRPGVSMIAEWGNSPYLNNSGEVTDFNFNSKVDQYFNKNNVQDILDIFEEKRVATNYNYDAFIGLVTNFSFTLREDGGYDCTLQVASHGTIIDSLSINNPPNELPSEDNTGTSLRNRSRLHEILYSFSEYLDSKDPASLKVLNFDTGIGNPDFLKALEKELVDSNLSSDKNKFFNLPGVKVFKDSIAARFGLYIGDVQYFRYITLRMFFGICNIALNSQKNEKELIGNRISLEPGQKYNTFVNHFSLDPAICLLPKKPQDIEATVFNEDMGYDLHGDISGKLKLLPEDDILEIRVSTVYLINKLEEFFNIYSNPEDANLKDFYKAILTDIQTELGLINEFDFYEDQDKAEIKIIDKKANPSYVPFNSNEKTPSVDIPFINSFGLQSTIQNLSIQSTITNDLGSMIAIAAQAKDSNSLNRNPAYVKWTKGIVDRFSFSGRKGTTTSTPPADTGNNEQEIEEIKPGDVCRDTEGERLEKFIIQVVTAYNQFNGRNEGIVRDIANYNTKLFKAFRDEGFARFRNLTEIEKLTKSNGKSTISATIPINVSMKLDGIGGIKIGQKFRIDKNSFILPDAYKDFGLITTGLEHTIENNKWNTTITAILYPL